MNELPPGWESKALFDAVVLQRGFDLPISVRRAGSVAVLGSNGQVGTHDEYPSGVPVPTLTVGRSGSVGKVCFSETGAWPLNTTLFAKDYCGNDPKYIYYWLQHFDLARYAQGVSVPTLNRNSFNSIQVNVPPLREQRSIARVLDRCWEAVSTERAIEETAAELNRAVMTSLFTRGVCDESQKETEIGLLPQNWEVVPFDEALKIAQGQVDPRVEPYASMLHIGPENVESQTGRLLPCRTARELGLISGKYFFANGDIVYSKIRPYLNKVAMPAFEGVCSADMYPMRAAEGFVARFLFYYLLSPFFLRQAVPHQLRTGIPKINREQLSDTSFPKPSLDEQSEIVEVLDALDKKINLHRQTRAVLQELFEALLHKLMTAEISVSTLDLSALSTASTRREMVAR